MVTYRIVIKDIAGNTLGEIEHFKNLRYKHVLNREGDCSFQVSLKDTKVTADFVLLGLREVYIYRNTDIVWGGILLNDSGSITGGDDMATLRAFGFFWYAKSWKIPGIRLYAASQATAIAWDLINYGQLKTNGNRFITQGTLPNSLVRDKQFENKSVYDGIIALSELKNGFDFEVTQTKVFNAYYASKGTDKSADVSFSLSKNASKLDYSSDYSSPMNRAIVEGGGFGEAMITTQRDDTDLQSSYGLYEDFVSYKDTEELTLLQERGDLEIARRGLPRTEYTLSQIPESNPVWNTLTVGDRVRLDIAYGYKTIYESVRINAIDIGVNDGVETPTYTFKYD